jgi:hypothetical protein
MPERGAEIEGEKGVACSHGNVIYKMIIISQPQKAAGEDK